MDISRVKYNLGKDVQLKLPRHYVDGKFLLSGCIIRKKPTGEFFYQAELIDKKSGSTIIASLGDIFENDSSPTVGK
ncbi:MAG: hypothetical protein J6A37_06920 [Oscillospiraceae bacterium]|nr:hypothetical protein [Oscillospiraceae bacterium]